MDKKYRCDYGGIAPRTLPFLSDVKQGIFSLVKEHLHTDGVMVVNMNMQAKGEGNINDYLSDTISEVFPAVYTADVEGTTNRELFASANCEIKENLEKNTAKIGTENCRT